MKTKVKLQVKVDHLREVKDIYREKTKRTYKIVLKDKLKRTFQIPVDDLPAVVQGEELTLTLSQQQTTINEYGGDGK